MSEIPDAGLPDPAIPGTSPGGMPPWAMMGVQLLDTLVQRLKGEDGAAGPGSASGLRPQGPPPASAGARLERACRLLSRHNQRVAGALGACRCWGLSPDCPRCGGTGLPGSRDVDPDAFAELVVPLLRAQPELFLRHLSRTVEVVPEK